MTTIFIGTTVLFLERVGSDAHVDQVQWTSPNGALNPARETTVEIAKRSIP
ncbi:MAG: hypothetical protein HOW73_13550 [Polyangiaceae bacterium]|nr:hypothetical protein [Polyangiaceae bacterium]